MEPSKWYSGFNARSSSAGVVTVYPTTPTECTEDGTATASRTWKTNLTDWIPPEFGATYQVIVYIHTSGNAGKCRRHQVEQIFCNRQDLIQVTNDEFFFDYQSGVLHFIGTNLPNGVNFSGKSVYVSGARYTGTIGVASLTAETGNFTFDWFYNKSRCYKC